MTTFASWGQVTNAFSSSVSEYRVVTHDGLFHADEVMATAIISFVRKISVVRTRNPIWENEEVDFVLDVGKTYDGLKFFDHHQCKEGIDGMATAGLIWKALGKTAIMRHYDLVHTLLSGVDLDKVVSKVAKAMINDIDRIDIGLRRPTAGEFTFSHFVSGFNSNTNKELGFIEAVNACRQALANAIANAVAECKDEAEAVSAFNNATNGIAVFDRFLTGWQEIAKSRGDIKRVVFPDLSGQWRVQNVPEADVPALTPSQVEGFVFCHPAGFIAGNLTKEGAYRQALEGL
jgi:uncharacterized UPF0160 family protein